MNKKFNIYQKKTNAGISLPGCILLSFLFMLISMDVFSDNIIEAENIGGGSFFLTDTTTGETTRSITHKTEVYIKVTGIILRGRVRQFFTNQSGKWMEGLYMFPLPETAAVDTLEMKVGERIITGEIREKEEARQIYEQSKEEGKIASLLDQERPNIFTISVANIGPGETIEVMIEYQQSVEYDQGTYSFTFPVVVGLRYIPLSMGSINKPDEHPKMTTDPAAGPVAEFTAITAPVDTGEMNGNTTSLAVKLDPGFPVKNITSPYLPVAIEHVEDGRFMIVPVGEKAENRDFVLRWEPENAAKTYTAVFREQVNGNLYSLVMIHPQDAQTASKPAYNREVIIIIDTSGSMQGTSIKQAKKALLFALDRLGADDIFNIIEFNTETRSLYNQSVHVNYRTISGAKTFVHDLNADRGTEMYPALVKALSGQRDPDRLLQVIFITDGCVGNEAELFTYIKQNIHNGRLFTVGIGSAPNHYFMRKAAQAGRGTFLYIGSVDEVTEKMDSLFSKLAFPVLTDISVNWSNTSAEILPYPVPDVYAGEPLTICTRSYLDAGELEINASFGEQSWHFSPAHTFSFDNTNGSSGIDKLWARRKIENLMDRLLEGEEEDKIKNAVKEVALEHHLVSRYTSLIAVEQIRSRPDGEQGSSERIPLKLPQGWTMGESPVHLPAAGTEMWFFLFIGIGLLTVSIFYLLLRRKI